MEGKLKLSLLDQVRASNKELKDIEFKIAELDKEKKRITHNKIENIKLVININEVSGDMIRAIDAFAG